MLMPELFPDIPAHITRKVKNNLQHKISPIGARIPVYGFPVLEVPERFPISDNPERHLKPQQIVEIHETKSLAYSPEEFLF